MNFSGKVASDTSFTGAYANMNGKWVNLLSKGQKNVEKAMATETAEGGGHAVKIFNAVDSATRKSIKSVDLLLTGPEKDMYLAGTKPMGKNDKIWYDKNPVRKKSDLLSSLFGGKLKFFGNYATKETEVAPVKLAGEMPKTSTLEHGRIFELKPSSVDKNVNISA